MGRGISERRALAAVILPAVLCIACTFPAAWSPDSTKVVLPVVERGGVKALLMADPSGKVLRPVARVRGRGARLSPAAWSPDGKWITYLACSVDPKSTSPAPVTLWSLTVQDAETGKERSVSAGKVSAPMDKLPGWMQANVERGPCWLPDSNRLAVRRAAASGAVLTVVDLDGKVGLDVPLPRGQLALATVTLSPDGKRMAYLSPAPGEDGAAPGRATVHVYEIGSGEARQLGIIEPGPPVAPGWSGDSQAVFVAAHDAKTGAGVVRRIVVKTGQAQTVWEKRPAVVSGANGCGGVGQLVVHYRVEDKKGGAYGGSDVVFLGKDRAIPVHFDEGRHCGGRTSPDGKWAAFTTFAGSDAKAARGTGVIVSAGGVPVRFVAAGPRGAAAVRAIAEQRARLAWRAGDFEKQLHKAGIRTDAVAELEHAVTIAAALDRMVTRQTAAIFVEGIACARVNMYLRLLDGKASRERAKAASAEVALFLKTFAGHPLGPRFKELLDGLLVGLGG